MAWVWTAVGVSGLLAAALAMAAGVAVFALGADRLQNRLLALFLLLLGAVSASGTGLMYLTSDARETHAWQVVWAVFEGPFLCAYLAFLSTIPTALTRPLARLRPALGVVGAALFVAMLFTKSGIVERVLPGSFAPWDAKLGPIANALAIAGALVSLFGLLVASLAYWQTARGSLARTQARAYLAAFAVLDVATLGVYAAYVLQADSVQASAWSGAALIFLRASASVFVLLLCYGILRGQLFDIDLKVKWTLKQSTVAAIFVAVFFAVSEGAAAFFTDRVGTFAGIGAAALLVFALAPLQRLAERLSDRAMPTVVPTPAYVAFRKMEVYKAAVEEVVADGMVSEKDRRVLERLRTQLGLSADDARAMENEITAARAGVA